MLGLKYIKFINSVMLTLTKLKPSIDTDWCRLMGLDVAVNECS